jgi:nucleotide-binding universal stress UspA family protein
MKKILVPTDFSECASKAAQTAMKISGTTDTEIHYLHIANVPIDWATMNDSEKRYPEVTKEIRHYQLALDKLVDESKHAGNQAHKYLIFNKNYKAILRHIDDHQIDMVIMGSNGATGLKELLMGSNTQKIVRLSPVPVLVVKDDIFDHFKLDRMVFVSDFREEVMDQFKTFVEFVQSLNAKLLLLFVNTPENFTDTLTTKTIMGNYAMHAPGAIENTYVFNSYGFMGGLDAFCQEHQVDAIGMITHGGSTGLHLFNSSLTEKVVNHSKIPVLTMHFG